MQPLITVFSQAVYGQDQGWLFGVELLMNGVRGELAFGGWRGHARGLDGWVSEGAASESRGDGASVLEGWSSRGLERDDVKRV